MKQSESKRKRSICAVDGKNECHESIDWNKKVKKYSKKQN